MLRTAKEFQPKDQSADTAGEHERDDNGG
jgi:hypothetical protein